jgi:hypothetical protein
LTSIYCQVGSNRLNYNRFSVYISLEIPNLFAFFLFLNADNEVLWIKSDVIDSSTNKDQHVICSVEIFWINLSSIFYSSKKLIPGAINFLCTMPSHITLLVRIEQMSASLIFVNFFKISFKDFLWVLCNDILTCKVGLIECWLHFWHIDQAYIMSAKKLWKTHY